MVKVTELGYMGFNVTDMAAWESFATDIVGMELHDAGEGDRKYLRLDDWHHRFVLHKSNEDDMAYIGWRVPGPDELEEMAAQLEAAKVPYRWASSAECDERRVLGLLKLNDPGGNPTEVFYGPEVMTFRPFHPGRPMFGRFVTGDQGVGHCILRQNDVKAAYDFYTKVFGMRGSVEYKLRQPDGSVVMPTFMHCNPRQHSVAFLGGPMPKRINHLMLEYTDLNDLGVAYHAVRARKLPMGIDIGKHSNDQAVTFYCGNPSGWLSEIGWGARSAPSQQEYYSADIWGHEVEASGFGMDLDMVAPEDEAAVKAGAA